MKLLALCALVLLTLPGCFEVIEDIWINADGSARFRVQVLMPLEAIDFAKSRGQNPVEEIEKGFAELKAQLEAMPGVRKIKLTSEPADDKYRLTYDFEVEDATQLGSVVRKATVPISAAGKQSPLSGLALDISRNSDGSYSFSQRYDPLTAPPEDGGIPPDRLKELRRFASTQVFGSNALKVNVHGDIVDTNAKERKDKSASWEIPLPLLLAPENDPLTLTVRTRPVANGVPAAALAGAFVLAVGAVIFLVLRSRRRRV